MNTSKNIEADAKVDALKDSEASNENEFNEEDFVPWRDRV